MAALVALLVATLAAPAGAQGAVTGTVSLIERAGAPHGDPRSAVVYLDPRQVPKAFVTDASLLSASIAMKGREFIPHVQSILVGGSVAFPNQDPFSHNVFSNVELGPFDLGLYRRGIARSASFMRAGVYPIYCNIHSRMVSFVVAVPTPLVTQPDEQGRFRIRDVPPGRYVVHAWHERAAGEITREITVGPAGATDIALPIDTRAWVSAQHLNKFGRPYAVSRADRY